MAYLAPKIKWKKQKQYREDVIATAKATGCVLQFWNCLLVGDALTILSIVDDEEHSYLIDAIYDTSNLEEWKNFRFNYRGLRLWSLTYEQELTTPLHITAGRGFADCLSLLLQRGANVDLAPGGNTALHEACESCQAECAKLLLIYGANPNAVSEDGLMPLHVCTSPQSLECAKYLLQYGATINGCTLDEDDSPLHIAARNGLGDHIELYLRHGASVDKQNNEGLTPLNAACARPQEMKDLGSYSKVLKHCSESPHTIEVLLNAYSHLKVTDAWVESVPEDSYKEHKDFYDSIFSLAKTPRSLQHLARCKLRSYLEGRVYKVVPKLDLPNFIKDYLLLECRGYVH